MDQLKPGGIILRPDLTMVTFIGPNAIELRLSPQAAIDFAEALVVTALQIATPDLIAPGTQFTVNTEGACTPH